MRISDWSSDVCSSDLNEVTPMNRKARKAVFKKGEEARISVISNLQVDHMPDRDEADHIQKNQTAKADEEDRIGRHFQVEAGIGKKEPGECQDRKGRQDDRGRSEEPRVGRACVGTWRSRGWPGH